LTAKIGNIAAVKACPKTGSINTKIGIALKKGIKALSNRALSNKALSSRALSNIYSKGVCK